MPRKPDGLVARTEHVTARFRPSTAASMDKMRGDQPRSRFLEQLVLQEERRRDPERGKKK